MIEPPRGLLETPIGPVHFTMTEALHVFLHTDSGNREAVTIRGIRYHVSYHCHLVDGQWTAKDWHNPYLGRKDCFNKEASQPARKTAREVLAKAWSEHLASHPQLSRQAEQAKADHEVRQLESELADLEEKARTKAAELTAAKERQAAI